MDINGCRIFVSFRSLAVRTAQDSGIFCVCTVRDEQKQTPCFACRYIPSKENQVVPRNGFSIDKIDMYMKEVRQRCLYLPFYLPFVAVPRQPNPRSDRDNVGPSAGRRATLASRTQPPP